MNLRLTNYKDKELVLWNANKVKSKNIFINEDFSSDTNELRKELWKKVKKYRDQEKKDCLNYKEIVFKRGNEEEKISVKYHFRAYWHKKITPESNFESMSYNRFSVNDNLTFNTDFDPDIYFFQKFSSLEKKYFSIDEVKHSKEIIFDKKSFSVLHLNIRSITKNFKCFKEFLNSLKVNIDCICLSETWYDSVDDAKSAVYILECCNSM